LIGAAEDWPEVAEAECFEIERGELVDGGCGSRHILREEAAGEHETAELVLHRIADEEDAAVGEVERDAARGVAGSMDNAHSTEGGELVPVIEDDVDTGGSGVVAEEVGFADAGEEGVLEWVGKGPAARYVMGFGEVDASLAGHPFLELGETTDVVDVVVGDDDVLDVFGGAAKLFDRAEDAFARARGAGINQGDVIFDDEVGLGTACADLVEPGEDFGEVAEGGGLQLVPAFLPLRAPGG